MSVWVGLIVQVGCRKEELGFGIGRNNGNKRVLLIDVVKVIGRLKRINHISHNLFGCFTAQVISDSQEC